MFLFELILYVTVIIPQSCQNVAWVDPEYMLKCLAQGPNEAQTITVSPS